LRRIHAEELKAAQAKPAAPAATHKITFGEFGELWTSGELHVRLVTAGRARAAGQGTYVMHTPPPIVKFVQCTRGAPASWPGLLCLPSSVLVLPLKQPHAGKCAAHAASHEAKEATLDIAIPTKRTVPQQSANSCRMTHSVSP
jgi:hypothetical protein